jgi:hypothetical protein
MTLLHHASVLGQPGTHVLAIGVGRYPHLLGGGGTLANKPLGLQQLQSPPVSLKALVDWFLAPMIAPGAEGFMNPSAPLASIEALASAEDVVSIVTPSGVVAVERATRQNIQQAFEDWLDRIKSHPENVGVFYFCGHGLMVSDHYLLAEDFGRSNAQPWTHAFDISNTIRAVEREVPGAVYYFIDACREIARDVAMTLGANPNALLAVDLNKKVVRKSVTAVFATGEGERAFAPKGGKVSRFTSALICAMSGFSGIKAPGATTWNVDGESVSTAVRQLLELEALETADKPGTGKQVSEQLVQGSSFPLLRLAVAPKVKVSLDLTPSKRRALYELYLESVKGGRVAQTMRDQVFKIEVTRGFYEVGAHDPAGALPAVQYPEEELVPPVYLLTMRSDP